MKTAGFLCAGQNGEEEKIAPWELTSNFEHNPIVSLSAPRPDFQGGLMQFLIGLLQTAAPPDEDNDLEWENWFEKPPKPEELRAKFDPFVDCFYLDGYGPRFMQDLELKKETAKVKEYSIYALLIDAPGENTVKNNTDHFVKRDCVIGMCYPCAATALFTLQTNAPSGGAGTSHIFAWWWSAHNVGCIRPTRKWNRNRNIMAQYLA